MRSSSRQADRRRFLQLLLIAALVLVSRAPFLVAGDRFFDSDEAVEGLMARHVLAGEFPAFLWGQRYKGVPEVYLAAAVFAVAGSSVTALKSVTLACFALFVCLQFVLVARVFTPAVAWMSTAFLIVGPPSLVLWSLSASAEVVMTMLAGTAMCLGVDVWRRTGSRAALLTACVAAGFGLWVQQYILYYWVALALAIFHWLPQRRALVNSLIAAPDAPTWMRVATAIVAYVAAVYVVLGITAFVTGGFDASLFGAEVGVHHAQKLWNIAAGLLLIAGGSRVLAIATRQGGAFRSLVYSAAAAFIVGYAPALAALAIGGGGPPIGRADLSGVAAMLFSMRSEIVPMVFGFRSPDTQWLGVPGLLALPVAVALATSFLAVRERPFTPLFHYLLVTAPLLFVVSGAYVDAQSYRYLMPIAGAMAVVLALGVLWIFQRSRTGGVLMLAALLMLFGLQQRAWYGQLVPDVQSRAMLACLERAGVGAATADYWASYKLTFLSAERIIVAPHNGVDRYPPYTERVRSTPGAPSIPDRMIGLSCTPDSLLSR
jgi:hypothetical protein